MITNEMKAPLGTIVFALFETNRSQHDRMWFISDNDTTIRQCYDMISEWRGKIEAEKGTPAIVANFSITYPPILHSHSKQ